MKWLYELNIVTRFSKAILTHDGSGWCWGLGAIDRPRGNQQLLDQCKKAPIEDVYRKKKELGIGEFTEFTYIILHNPMYIYIYYTGTVHHMMCCVGWTPDFTSFSNAKKQLYHGSHRHINLSVGLGQLVFGAWKGQVHLVGFSDAQIFGDPNPLLYECS